MKHEQSHGERSLNGTHRIMLEEMTTTARGGFNGEPGETKTEGSRRLKIALLIPCYNEEVTISGVVGDFRRELPDADIHVFDNNSSDRTAERARAAGAIVSYERRQGKGHVVQAMFRHVEADIYVLVDGDGTYPPAAVHDLLAPVIADVADTVVGSRLHRESDSDFRFINRLGNRFYKRIINLLFRVELTDILSGYRVFNRRFVKDIPLFGGGFEIETELTIKGISRGFRTLEVPVGLSRRPPDSHSKINLFRDGFLITNTILTLFRDYKPLTFFGVAAVLLAGCGAALGVAALLWIGEASRMMLALLAAATLMLLFAAGLTGAVGLILHAVARRAQEHEYQMRRVMDELKAHATKR